MGLKFVCEYSGIHLVGVKMAQSAYGYKGGGLWIAEHDSQEASFA